jgi:hypothetical protein
MEHERRRIENSIFRSFLAHQPDDVEHEDEEGENLIAHCIATPKALHHQPGSVTISNFSVSYSGSFRNSHKLLLSYFHDLKDLPATITGQYCSLLVLTCTTCIAGYYLRIAISPP